MAWGGGVAHAASAILLAGIVIALLLSPYAYAAAECAPTVARIESIQGRVELRRSRTASWQEAQAKSALCTGDTLRVGGRSRAALLLANETTLRLDQNTALTVSGVDEAKASLLDLLLGTIHVITRTPRPFKIKTPFVNAGVEGTEFLVAVSAEETRIAVFEGQVSAANDFGTLMLVSGEMAIAARNLAPRKERLIRPTDAVQWALYYPTIIDYRLDERVSGAAAEPALRESIELYRQGRPAEAIFRLDNVSEGARDPRFLTYRAGLLLLVGRADEAGSDIERALALDPGNSTAHALQSVVAVVQNDKAQALKLASRAVELDQTSPMARIALSYAQQAHFKIEEALATVQKAVELDSQNALAWARLAELHMSTGYLDRALEAANRAVALNPDIAKTQSVLGFANLTRIDTQAAKEAFRKAIELDQADPLPRLGLGLAKIREGELTAGREEIEIAVSLDPENSLLRSYVGKAYYEEKRDELAGIQFELAKERDPRDPTPWFYDAIRKQTENRPVEALRDLEKSIELNDNRAVYRSQLLLDQDRATRGTSLSRIYDDLGFDQLAVVEASKSLSLDPSNHSAHRFLSDAYARMPRHEIARVSELLQAQLLQPINIHPVQPRLAIKGIDIASGIGPAHAAFNEYTPLFERDRPRLTISGTTGNNDTYGDEAVLSGLLGRFSYSFGQYHYETKGFRPGSDIEHDIYNAFAQVALSNKLNVQLEFRHRNTTQGDIRTSLDPEFVPMESRSLQQDVGRVGVHVSSSPRSELLGSLIYSDRSETLRREQRRLFANDQNAYQAEGQYLYRAERINLILGAGAYGVGVKRATITENPGSTSVIPLGPGLPPLTIEVPPSVSREESHSDTKSEILYVYSNFRFPADLLWTLGLSYETYEETGSGSGRLREANPKLGLQWDIADRLRFRTAFARTLKRVLAVDQTIEPTQVAGFTQFFDDFNGTRTDLFGIGIDARLATAVYGGLESTRRDLRPPNNAVGDLEQTYRAYLYWTLKRSWCLSAEYQFRRDQFNRSQLALELETRQIPLAIRYFGAEGFFGQIGPTFVSQTRLENNGRQFRGSFAVVDAAIGYRLPERRGVLTLGITNLFDQQFRFQDFSFKTSDQFDLVRPFLPVRTVMVRAVLNF